MKSFSYPYNLPNNPTSGRWEVDMFRHFYDFINSLCGEPSKSMNLICSKQTAMVLESLEDFTACHDDTHNSIELIGRIGRFQVYRNNMACNYSNVIVDDRYRIEFRGLEKSSLQMEDIPGLSIESNEISERTRKIKARWSPMSEAELKAIMEAIAPSVNEFDSGYDESQPTMGFFDWGGVDPARVAQEYPGRLSRVEKEYVLSYMKNASKETRYMGSSRSRMDGTFLGSHDMRTPDGKWIFPEKWDTHYVDEYNVAPPEEFVMDAVEWVKNNQQIYYT